MNGLVYTNPENPNGLNQAGTTATSNPQTVNTALQNNAYATQASILTGQPTSPTPFANQNTDNHPIQSASGQWVSSATGQPWHGSYQNPNGSTQYFSNGAQVSDIGQVGNQMPNISVQQIQKNPAISGQVAGAVGQNAQNTSLLSKSFADYLNEANQIASQVPGQEQQAIAAVNPAGTINRLNSDVNTSDTNLNNTLNTYEGNQVTNQANIAGANSQYQTNQQSALTNLGNTLNTEQQNYATAAQGVAGQAYANALKNINLYQLTGPTPTSGSGALDNRYIAAYNNINLPLQQQLAQMQMGTTNQLYGLGSGLQNQYLSNLQSQFAGQGALNSDLASRATANNQYSTGLDQNTAQYIQGLQQQVATMQPQVALQYLSALGIPLQTAQSIISGNTQNLAGLTGLDQQANFYNLVGNVPSSAPGYASPRLSIPSVAGNSFTGNSGNGLNGLLAQGNSYLNSLPGGQSFNAMYPTAMYPTATNALTPTPMTDAQAGQQYTDAFGPNYYNQLA